MTESEIRIDELKRMTKTMDRIWKPWEAIRRAQPIMTSGAKTAHKNIEVEIVERIKELETQL